MRVFYLKHLACAYANKCEARMPPDVMEISHIPLKLFQTVFVQMKYEVKKENRTLWQPYQKICREPAASTYVCLSLSSSTGLTADFIEIIKTPFCLHEWGPRWLNAFYCVRQKIVEFELFCLKQRFVCLIDSLSCLSWWTNQYIRCLLYFANLSLVFCHNHFIPFVK